MSQFFTLLTKTGQGLLANAIAYGEPLTIAELAIGDGGGNLIAYGNYPKTYKPQLSEGSSRTQTIRFVMEVTDTSAVTLRIDPSVVMASRKYVDDSIEAHAKSRNHPAADTKNSGMMRFATLAESRKGEESKAAQTPTGGMAQLDDHRAEEAAHNAGQITLDAVLSVFGENRAGSTCSTRKRLQAGCGHAGAGR